MNLNAYAINVLQVQSRKIVTKENKMRPDIHPDYREVLFHDTSVDEYFIIGSTLKTNETKKWKPNSGRKLGKKLEKR